MAVNWLLMEVIYANESLVIISIKYIHVYVGEWLNAKSVIISTGTVFAMLKCAWAKCWMKRVGW